MDYLVQGLVCLCGYPLAPPLNFGIVRGGPCGRFVNTAGECWFFTEWRDGGATDRRPLSSPVGRSALRLPSKERKCRDSETPGVQAPSPHARVACVAGAACLDVVNRVGVSLSPVVSHSEALEV